jgi:hypothetical protein
MPEAFAFNRDEIEDDQYELIPDGVYCAKIVTATKGEALSSRRSKVEINYDVFLDTGLPEGHPDMGTGKVKKLRGNINLTALPSDKSPTSALWQTKQFFDALKIWGENGSPPDISNEAITMWIGCYVRLTLTHSREEYNGNAFDKNKIKKISAATDAEAAELDREYSPF